jgi:hypothetical protein
MIHVAQIKRIVHRYSNVNIITCTCNLFEIVLCCFEIGLSRDNFGVELWYFSVHFTLKIV